VAYIVRYNHIGEAVNANTVFTPGGTRPLLEVPDAPAGDYFASVSSVDVFGQESEPAEISFSFSPVVPIGPQNVRGLRQLNPPGTDSAEVHGENFVITWERSANVQDIGGTDKCSTVPILKGYRVRVWSFIDDDATTGINPLDGTDRFNLKDRMTTLVTDNRFTYDIATNTEQGFTDPDLPSTSPKQPDRKLIFEVRMVDIQNNESDPSVITLENTPPPLPTVVAVPVGSRQLGIQWRVDTDDPDFRGVAVWMVEGDDPDFEAVGSRPGEGNMVFMGNESPAKWDAEPLTDYTVKVAAIDAFPVVPDKLDKVTL
jgi:hypothetical protein